MAEVVQYTTREMLDAMKQAPRPTTFLQDLVIGRRLYTDKTILEIDIDKGGETISPYVSRVGDPTPVGKDGFDTLLHAAPYIYDEITYTPSDGDQRTVGETIYQSDAQSNIDTRTADWLNKLQDRMIRREEQQVAEALQTGKVVVSGVGTAYTVDYQMDAGHIITLTGGDVWGSSTELKIDQFEAWSTLIQDKGAPTPEWAVLDFNSAQLLRKDSVFLALLDNRRVKMGEIDFKTINGQRASFIGTLDAIGLNIDLYSYQGSYKNDAGTRVRFMNDDQLILGSSQARVDMHYAKIENFNAPRFIGRQFPQMGIEPKGKKGYVSLESGPLVGLHQPDAFVTVNVK